MCKIVKLLVKGENEIETETKYHSGTRIILCLSGSTVFAAG